MDREPRITMDEDPHMSVPRLPEKDLIKILNPELFAMDGDPRTAMNENPGADRWMEMDDLNHHDSVFTDLNPDPMEEDPRTAMNEDPDRGGWMGSGGLMGLNHHNSIRLEEELIQISEPKTVANGIATDTTTLLSPPKCSKKKRALTRLEIPETVTFSPPSPPPFIVIAPVDNIDDFLKEKREKRDYSICFPRRSVRLAKKNKEK